jgi:hypothetical protein
MVTVKVVDRKPTFEEVPATAIFGILATRGRPHLRALWIRARSFRQRLATLRLLGAQHPKGSCTDPEPVNVSVDFTVEDSRGG